MPTLRLIDLVREFVDRDIAAARRIGRIRDDVSPRQDHLAARPRLAGSRLALLLHDPGPDRAFARDDEGIWVDEDLVQPRVVVRGRTAEQKQAVRDWEAAHPETAGRR